MQAREESFRTVAQAPSVSLHDLGELLHVATEPLDAGQAIAKVLAQGKTFLGDA